MKIKTNAECCLSSPEQKHSSDKMFIVHPSCPADAKPLVARRFAFAFLPAKNCSGSCLPGTAAEKKCNAKNGLLVADSCWSAGANAQPCSTVHCSSVGAKANWRGTSVFAYSRDDDKHISSSNSIVLQYGLTLLYSATVLIFGF